MKIEFDFSDLERLIEGLMNGNESVKIQKMEHQGITGTMEYAKKDGVYFGALDLPEESITYEAKDLNGLREEFEKEVNKYVEEKKTITEDNIIDIFSKAISYAKSKCGSSNQDEIMIWFSEETYKMLENFLLKFCAYSANRELKESRLYGYKIRKFDTGYSIQATALMYNGSLYFCQAFNEFMKDYN